MTDYQREYICALAMGRGGAATLWKISPAQPQVAPDSTGRAVVDRTIPWRPIDANTPRNCKLQLINRSAGVAQYGALKGEEGFFTHWAPLPVFE